MGIRIYKPTSAGRRNASVSTFEELTFKGNNPEKSLIRRATKTGGRNHQGKITAHHRGGGHKRMYRIIDFKRRVDGVAGLVKSVEYDPNRSSNIALICYEDGQKAYIIAPAGLVAGDKVYSGDSGIEPKVGNSMPLSQIPLGSVIHNIELQPGRGGQLCRSAGTSAVMNAREGNWAQITLPSGEVRRVPSSCRATMGEVGNSDHQNVVLGKAGRRRWMGWRPHVRGTCKNPHDHPHGGGEGRTKGGRHPCSPTGKLSKGGATRKKKKASSNAILRRRKSRRNGQLK
ncbi:MAG: 50S ribosomal protein L2 [Planctomycetota bacterium]|nr:50S ribosomal protein L2 [Planctomycetota bacterium]MDA0920515.1 50S ribosomal protein L2 [Planctomycetota bacterium]